MKLTYKKTENHDVNLSARAILYFFSKSYILYIWQNKSSGGAYLCDASGEHGLGLSGYV